MRTIKIEFAKNQNYSFITDWNFKKWKLNKNTDQMYECSEMTGCLFKSINDFVTKMYGHKIIYPEWNRYDVFVNYEITINQI